MATSDLSYVPIVLSVVRTLRPESICDIGVGCGKYGLLFREALDLKTGASWEGSLFRRDLQLDGVEVYPNYLGKLQNAIYDKIFVGDARVLGKELGHYDLFTMIDVVEHMDIKSGVNLIETLRSKSRFGVLILTPIQPQKQGIVLGNEYEAHVSKWGRNQWDALGGTRYMIAQKKWLVLVEGKESGIVTWLRPPRFRRRCKLAFLRAVDALFPGRISVPIA